MRQCQRNPGRFCCWLKNSALASSALLSTALLSTLLLGIASLTACSDTANKRATLDEPLVLRAGNGTEPQDLDPHTVTGAPERNISLALFEGLLLRDPQTLELLPGVAKSWHYDAEQNTYHFTLRESARWSNGDPVTAHDFVYSWRRILHPLLGNEYADSMYAIANAEQYHQGENHDFSYVGVKALNDYELQFTLTRRDPLFIESLASPGTLPVHQPTIEKFGEIHSRGTAWTRPANLVSNGPFQLREWLPNQRISVRKSDTYWDKDSISLEGIDFYAIENLTTEERMFRTGQLDLTMGGYVQAEKIVHYQQEKPESILLTPAFATYFYILNTREPPLDDIRVRSALAMTIDRESIVNNITRSGQTPAYALNPPNADGYQPVSDIHYNPEKARQLLSEAGYPNGEGFPVLDVLYNTVEQHKKIALAIQQMWKTHLNIDVTLRNEEWKVYLNTRKAGRFNIARAGLIGSTTDPADFLDSYTSNSGMNDTGWANASFDEIVEQAKQIEDKPQRYQMFQQAEKILTDELPLIPIYYYTKAKLISPAVLGWHENLSDYPAYRTASLRREPGEKTEIEPENTAAP